MLRVLIVEDNPSDADLMLRRLNKDGYLIDWHRVDDEENYLAALEHTPDLILSDWSLPEFSGLRALQIVHDRELDIPFVIVSGSIGEEAAVHAMHIGAADYILKDRPERLGQAIHNALEQKRLRDERRQAEQLLLLQSAALNAAANAIAIAASDGKIEWINPAFTTLTGYEQEEAVGKTIGELADGNLHDPVLDREMRAAMAEGKIWRGEKVNRRKDGTLYVEELTITPVVDSGGETCKFVTIAQDISERKRSEQMLREASEELRLAYDATLQGWSSALELRERETAGHAHRVVKATLRLARALGVEEDQLVHIQRGALLHDIGKMGIPDHILLKPGPLDEEEWVIMRQHPVYAYDMLAPIPYLTPALDIPLYHHERWDGRGYPSGLSGEGIPLAARIFAVVDVWDALAHDRPYRPAWSAEETIEYIRKQSGTHFDPRVVNAFIELMASGKL